MYIFRNAFTTKVTRTLDSGGYKVKKNHKGKNKAGKKNGRKWKKEDENRHRRWK
jgi:prophage tail gpP-like protein